jgi:hypothetical protein
MSGKKIMSERKSNLSERFLARIFAQNPKKISEKYSSSNLSKNNDLWFDAKDELPFCTA